MSRICILGHRGMLGNILFEYFHSLGHECLTIDRKFSIVSAEIWFDELIQLKPDWVINATSFTSKSPETKQTHWEVNFSLPFLLAKALPDGIGFIQPSTDAVFPCRGGGPYWAEDPLAPDDDFGLAKKMSEECISRPYHFIIRTSLIGPEVEGVKKNLLAWTLNQGSTFSGFSNHRFNGITTLQWAKLAEKIMNGEFPDQKLLQPAIDPALSLVELMTMIRETWKMPAKIQAVEAPTPLNRIMISNVPVPFLQVQLEELYSWMSLAK